MKTNTNWKREIPPIFNEVREKIENIEDYKIKNILRIAYVFGGKPSEYLGPRKTRGQGIKGNDFSEETIDDTEAITLRLPKNRMGGKIRVIAIPLNPNIEPMSKHILKFSEEQGHSSIWDKYYEQFWADLKKITNPFNDINIPLKPSRKRKDQEKKTKKLTFGYLPEIRQVELGLCHNFNELDFKLFFGDLLPSNFRVYFNKLLSKSDFYYYDDVYKMIEIKDTIFNPRKQMIYHYKDYMKLIKLINRGYILRTEEIFDIDVRIKIEHLTASKSGKDEHKILMANAMEILNKDSRKVFAELDNIDVFDEENQKAIECGLTNAKKLLDLYNNNYPRLKNIEEFWVMTFWGYPNTSKCYKFKLLRN